jgi:hypothetical protein
MDCGAGQKGFMWLMRNTLLGWQLTKCCVQRPTLLFASVPFEHQQPTIQLVTNFWLIAAARQFSGSQAL